jgi:hypothetical protein
MGAGCKPGEFLLRFEVENSFGGNDNGVASIAGVGDVIATASSTANVPLVLGDIKIREKMTVAQVKALVLTRINELISSNAAGFSLIPPVATVNHLRLRDGKNKGSSTGGPLRDERIIGRCLLNMDDGRRIVVQVS